MKKTITLLLLTLFTGLLSAQTVSIQGGSTYGTITEAITAAVAGDVILISGVFTEPITISKSITLRGTNPATDIIQAAAAPSSDGSGVRAVTLTGSGTPIAPLTITIENLGIKNGNTSSTLNGGGIFIDKITGLATLKNLIIENNYSGRNGGGVSIDGSNANIIECTIKNNSALTNGGGIIIAANNAAAIDSNINIKQSLIDSNTVANGGGIYINAGNSTTYKVTVNIENSTISNNVASSASTAAGGGAIYTQNGATSGLGTLKMVHTTVYNNSHLAAIKAGIQFAGTAGSVTNFSAYNSIIVAQDDLLIKALNFANTNTTSIVNCILGGTNAPPTLVSDPTSATTNNIATSKTATQAGLDISNGLQNLGGKTKVMATLTGASAIDFCTATTGITVPTIDQRGYTRTTTQDAGAFELGGTLSLNDNKMQKNSAVSIFPNPSSSFVKISGLDTIKVVRVYSVNGALKKVIYGQDELDVSKLSKGMYVLIIESDGQKIVKRIIVN